MAESDYRLDLACERGGRIWENHRILVGQLGDGDTMHSGRVAGSAGPLTLTTSPRLLTASTCVPLAPEELLWLPKPTVLQEGQGCQRVTDESQSVNTSAPGG